MKLYRMTGVVVVSLGVLLILGAVIVAAQAPIGSGPSGVPYADNQIHTIPANSSVLYRFDYSLDTLNGIRPVTTILLVNGYNGGVNFEVWTPDAVSDMGNNHPVGRGNSVTIDCDTRLPLGSGQCLSPDLQWSGAFGGSGTYYVRVVNSNNTQSNFQLAIQGTGVGLGSQTAAALAAPTSTLAPTQVPTASPTPTVATSPTVNTDDPNRAGTIDGQPHTLPAHSAVWYRFDYANNHMTGQRPLFTITLVNGNNSGLGFEVYAPENIGGWWNNHPTGRGTVEMIDCDTGQPSETGQCQSPDLVWQGNFGADGTYYVRAVNSNDSLTIYLLTIQNNPS